MKYIFFLVVSFSLAQHSFSQGGSINETLAIKSKVLGREVPYAVYLPRDYQTSSRSYPVFYLLHGYGDDHTGWVQFGEVAHIADRAIASGDATPMIIVMPNGFKSYYLNSYDSTLRYEDFFFSELMPEVERTFRIRRSREYRAVGGLSMGGYGSFLYALRRPDLFGAATPLSAAVRTDEEMANMKDENYERSMAPLFGSGLKGSQRLNKTWYHNSVLKLLETKPLDSVKAVRWYMDCGDDDFLSTGNVAVHAVLKKREVPHEFRMRDGLHNWTYWRTSLPDVLQFISRYFHK